MSKLYDDYTYSQDNMKNSILILYMPTVEQKILPYPPLGISVLSGYLKRKGIEVRIDDLDIKMTYFQEDTTDICSLKMLIKNIFLKYKNSLKVFFDIKKVINYLEAGKCDSKLEKILNECQNNLNINKFTHIGFSIMSWSQLITSTCFAKYLKCNRNIWR